MQTTVGQLYSYTVNVVDDDGDSFSMLKTTASWLTLTQTNILSGVPNEAKLYSVKLIAGDGKSKQNKIL